MTVSCGTITVWIPTHIEATNIQFSTIDCDQPCNITVTVTWTNTGGRPGSFVPNIAIDGIAADLIYPSELLAGGATTTHIFTVTGLTVTSGSFENHSICPIPN